MGRLKVEALREDVHCFDGSDYTPTMDGANVLCCTAAMQGIQGGRLTMRTRTPTSSATELDAKTPASGAGVKRRSISNAVRLARDRCAGNAADVSAVDTEVLQLTAGHAAEFGDGLTELAPVVERACYVHDNPLS